MMIALISKRRHQLIFSISGVQISDISFSISKV